MSDATLTFQDVLMRLQQYWASQGCVISHPYNAQVGAGTMNPATFLRVIGPEPWNVVYLEPSVRPDDGRYGENPNRLQQHMQLQVILKPDPGNPQELYLQSLEVLGIDRNQHDIRFVEDNWKSPALGAWGLGWEVWLNGLEITQFTYFQQAGGVNTDPVSVEITYGLERIVMALQNVASFREVAWSDRVAYGELYLQGEQEHSAYYFERADVERLRELYVLYEEEFGNAMEAGLVLPAYDQLLRCSHTFNVLDTRGAIGVTERAGYFGRMRNMARKVAELYIQKREAQGFPLLKGQPVMGFGMPAVAAEAVNWTPDAPQPYVLEIGVEELPASEVSNAAQQLREMATTLLNEARLPHGDLQVSATPRRLVLQVADVAPSSPQVEIVHRGPKTNVAFDGQGQPTKAAEGFARRFGLTADQLVRQTVDGVEYITATVTEAGRPAPQVLAEIGAKLVNGLTFRETMRWLPGANSPAFSRPVRWLVSLLGDRVAPFAAMGLVAGRQTYPLRALGSRPVEVPAAGDYAALAAGAQVQVTLDAEERRAQVLQVAQALAAEVGGQIPSDEDLLEEIVNLVEQPNVFRGTFEAEYLSLPREALVAVMRKHQRYFPVMDAAGDLLPYFIGVCNGPRADMSAVIAGNAHVIRARFADAAYFVRADQKHTLDYFRDSLYRLTFQEKLGSMLDKSGRVAALVGRMGLALGLTTDEMAVAQRAAHLCKADLASQMVVEMTSLQGIMGRNYALHSGEPAAVAQAIEQHYWAGGEQQPATPGLAVGLADRIDSLVGLFAVGLAPTGSADPYGMRRAAVGVVQLLLGARQSLDLRQFIAAAATLQPVEVSASGPGETLTFIQGRLKVVLQEQGLRYDVVDAALLAQGHDPYAAQVAAQQLTAWMARSDWAALLAAYARCVRITRKETQPYAVDPAVFETEAERTLWQALQQAEAAQASKTVTGFFTAFVPLVPAISAFFEAVLVMADDPAVRAARLGLLQRIAAMADRVIDLSVVEGF